MENFRSIAQFLLRETFEGRPDGANGTYFVEGIEGVFEVFDRISAEQASQRVGGKGSTIYAHLNHARYYLSLMPAHFRGEEVLPDWEGSWAQQGCNDDEWRQLRLDIEKEYKDALENFASAKIDESETTEKWVVAQLSHSAYHLGAVRALIPLVE